VHINPDDDGPAEPGGAIADLSPKMLV
jgi:hypothetical protein